MQSIEGIFREIDTSIIPVRDQLLQAGLSLSRIQDESQDLASRNECNEKKEQLLSLIPGGLSKLSTIPALTREFGPDIRSSDILSVVKQVEKYEATMHAMKHNVTLVEGIIKKYDAKHQADKTATFCGIPTLNSGDVVVKIPFGHIGSMTFGDSQSVLNNMHEYLQRKESWLKLVNNLPKNGVKSEYCEQRYRIDEEEEQLLLAAQRLSNDPILQELNVLIMQEKDALTERDLRYKYGRYITKREEFVQDVDYCKDVLQGWKQSLPAFSKEIEDAMRKKFGKSSTPSSDDLNTGNSTFIKLSSFIKNPRKGKV